MENTFLIKKNDKPVFFDEASIENCTDAFKAFDSLMLAVDGAIVQECIGINYFSGSDIDVISKTRAGIDVEITGNVLRKRERDNSLRFLCNCDNSKHVLSIDVENVSLYDKYSRNIMKKAVGESFICLNTGHKHLQRKHIVYYKFVKYFVRGFVHSYPQIKRLKVMFNSLSADDKKDVMSILMKTKHMPTSVVESLLHKTSEEFENDVEVNKFLIKKRLNRHKERRAFGGKMHFTQAIKCFAFIYAFVAGRFARWPRTHSPLPAIAIVGNDGCGKTTVCEELVSICYKMDPVHINMRTDATVLPWTPTLRSVLKKLARVGLFRKNRFFKQAVGLLGELNDVFDKFVRFRLGMAWADSGLGVTIFERYPTDRVRGEFPHDIIKWWPIEQFFPLPDGIIYLDVSPEDTLKRKSCDGHTVDEMKSKRDNYLSLLREFSTAFKVDNGMSKEETISVVKKHLWLVGLNKTTQVVNNKKTTRVKWFKNRDRKLSGSATERQQKDGFL